MEILQIPHHGAKNGLSFLVLDEAASLAVISVGGNNDYGYPNIDTRSLLKTCNVKILRTNENGVLK